MLTCKIILDNCINIEKYIENNSIHLIITSPVYYGHPSFKEFWKNISIEEYQDQHKKFFEKFYRVLVPGCYMIINSAPCILRKELVHNPAILLESAKAAGFKLVEELFWVKPSGARNEGARKGASRCGVLLQNPYPTYYYPALNVEYLHVFKKGKKRRKLLPHQKERNEFEKHVVREILERNQLWHINPTTESMAGVLTPFPEKLIHDLIMLYSLEEDIVMDPFAGRGTVIKMALKLQRSGIGFEIKKEYKETIKKYLEWGQQQLIPVKYEMIEPETEETPLVYLFEGKDL
jgi:DNA modification methylase